MDSDLATAKSSYREVANHALAGYQLVEELLKTYIGNHFEIARSLLGDRLHLDFTRKDYEKAPLGRLLQVFAKLCPDAKLVADLRAELPHRDHVAHQSLLILFSSSPASAEFLHSHISDLVERNDSIASLLGRLNEAHARLTAPYKGVTSDGT